MEWWGYLTILVGSLLLLLMTGMPIAFCFLLIDVFGIIFFMGGTGSLPTLVLSIYDTLASFVLSPVPLFIFMGEILFQTNVAYRAMNNLEKFMGKIPGRLSFLAVLSGTIFASLTGSGMSSAAMLGSTLVPEMQRRGYDKSMSLGPIIGSGGLAIMIPPSSLAVILGSLAFIPIGKLLIGGIMPGLLMALLFTLYIVIRCSINPSLAPMYDVTPTPMSQNIRDFAKYVMPLSLVVFMVIGLMIIGAATPSEAAAGGALASMILGLVYGDLNRVTLKKAVMGTFQVTTMVLMIIGTATMFSQLMGYTGAIKGFVQYMLSLKLGNWTVLIMMNVILLILGCLMEQVCIMIITIPLFMPLVHVFGFDPLWFGILMLINMEVAVNSPPFGLILFVMKGIAPPGVTMTDVYKAAIPFVLMEILALVIVMLFPKIGTWLPSLMG